MSALSDFWANYGKDLEELGVLTAGILVYALVVNAFYQIISKRAMLGRSGLGYVFMFPLISFMFFLMISASLIFLSDETQAALPIFTLAMALIAAVRIAAYFNEATSHDLAKLLPLGLLGVFLVRLDFQSIESSFKQLATLGDRDVLILVGLYFAIIVMVEYLLRAVYVGALAAKESKKRRAAP